MWRVSCFVRYCSRQPASFNTAFAHITIKICRSVFHSASFILRLLISRTVCCKIYSLTICEESLFRFSTPTVQNCVTGPHWGSRWAFFCQWSLFHFNYGLIFLSCELAHKMPGFWLFPELSEMPHCWASMSTQQSLVRAESRQAAGLTWAGNSQLSQSLVLPRTMPELCFHKVDLKGKRSVACVHDYIHRKKRKY